MAVGQDHRCFRIDAGAEVASFLRFALEPARQRLVTGPGYHSLPAALVAAQRQAIDAPRVATPSGSTEAFERESAAIDSRAFGIGPPPAHPLPSRAAFSQAPAMDPR
jgi:hypothetical protein